MAAPTHYPTLLALVVLVAPALSGCFGGTAPSTPDGTDSAADPTLACPPPCARSIDSGVRWEPSVAINPLDPRHIVASSQDQGRNSTTGARDSWALSHVTFDGGETWQTVRLPGGPTAPPTHPLFRFNSMDDSAVAFLPDGTLLWSTTAKETLLGPNTGYALVILRSPDGGLTFPDIVIVQDGTGADVGLRPALNQNARVAFDAQDKQWLAVGPDGLVLVVWARNWAGHPECAGTPPLAECSRIVFSTSRDGGRTWTPQGVIDEGILSGPFPLIRDDGAWLVSYRDTAQRRTRIAITTDQGATWTRETYDATTKFPVLAKSHTPTGERIYMAYPQSEESSHDDMQTVHVQWSDDGGATWTAPIPIHQPTHAGRAIPAIAPAPHGGAYITFFQTHEGGAQLQAVLVRDGNVSPPITLDITDAPTFLSGDYMGLAPLPDGSAFAVWVARHGTRDDVMGARMVAEG